jgi:hypothetical protein
MPVLYIQGTEDPFLPIGGDNCLASFLGAANYWASYNNCDPVPDTLDLDNIDLTDNSTVRLLTYQNCENNNSVLVYLVEGGGHTWPGGYLPDGWDAYFGRLNNDIHASAEIWKFFKTKTLPDLPVQIPEFTRIDTGALASEYTRGRGMYPVDFDNDGDLDLYIGNSTGFNKGQNRPNLVFKNERDLRFLKVSDGILATKVYTKNPGNNWGDADNDGDWDLFNHGELYLNDGFGNFAISPDIISYEEEYCATWIDFDGASKLDIYTNVFPHSNHMYRNNGDNTFTEVSIGTPTDNPCVTESPAWADIDNDGDLDLFESNFLHYYDESTPVNNKLYINNNDGTFSELDRSSPIVSDGLGANGSTWGDYDNDGDMDLYVFSVMHTGNYLYRNNGNLDFERISIEPDSTKEKFTYSGSWGDFNNDGYLDLIVGNINADSVLFTKCTFRENLFFLNNGDGTFRRKTSGNIITDGAQALAVNDFDNDGDLDVIVTHGSLAPPHLTYIYANNGNDNYWLNFTLEGRYSNRSAIGARVRVKARISGNEVWMLRELTQENGLHSCNGARLHFGLGDAETADTVIIRWPSGHVDTIRDLPAKKFYIAIEDSTTTVDYSATNYIQLSPLFDLMKIPASSDSIINLRDHYRMVSSSNLPENYDGELDFRLHTNDNEEAVVATLADGILTLEAGSSEDTSIIQVVASAGFTQRMDHITVKVTLPVSDRVPGIHESKIKCYPNPANQSINIETPESIPFAIEISSLTGQLIHRKELDASTSQIDISSFRTGIYFITISSKDFVTSRKIIKL